MCFKIKKSFNNMLKWWFYESYEYATETRKTNDEKKYDDTSRSPSFVSWEGIHFGGDSEVIEWFPWA